MYNYRDSNPGCFRVKIILDIYLTTIVKILKIREKNNFKHLLKIKQVESHLI